MLTHFRRTQPQIKQVLYVSLSSQIYMYYKANFSILPLILQDPFCYKYTYKYMQYSSNAYEKCAL